MKAHCGLQVVFSLQFQFRLPAVSGYSSNPEPVPIAMTDSPRRFLRTRERRSSRELARLLGNAGVRPNGVSVLSIVFAAVAGYALWLSGDSVSVWPLVLAAAGIQLRLLCNMLDGLLAVEGGFKSAVGDLYNEIPDRIADAVILVGAGFSVRALPYGEALGWTAALLAVFTAYIRLLAGSLGATQLFIGPMAKQHRMFVLTVGCLAGAVEQAMAGTHRAVYVALIMIVIGAAVTAVRRIGRLAAEMKAK